MAKTLEMHCSNNGKMQRIHPFLKLKTQCEIINQSLKQMTIFFKIFIFIFTLSQFLLCWEP